MPDIELWEIFAGLGIPGIALGVFYMLFRSFKWNFPKVPRAYVGPIIILFMLLTSSVVIYSLSLFSPKGSGGSPKSIPDLNLVDLSPAKGLSLDFKLKNSGIDSAFLHNVVLRFRKEYPSDVWSECSYVDAHIYEVEIPETLQSNLSTEKEIEINIPISQSVPPNGVDRFIVSFKEEQLTGQKFNANGDLLPCTTRSKYRGYAIIEYNKKMTYKTPQFVISYRGPAI